LHNAVQQKMQQLYGDFGVAAIKAGFSGNIKFQSCSRKIKLEIN
ncbi:unnamed protein product, partial [Heterotrigona itama]